MSVSIQTKVTLPDYSSAELKEKTKNHPLVDDYQHYPAGKKEQDKAKNVKAIKLPKFFNTLIENRVNEVAIMVLFHIIHFFCHKFWPSYRVEFDYRMEAKEAREEETKKLKIDKLKLQAKVNKFLKKKDEEKHSQASAGTNLSDLNTDLLQSIAGNLSPVDRANFAQTCKFGNEAVKGLT